MKSPAIIRTALGAAAALLVGAPSAQAQVQIPGLPIKRWGSR